MRALAFGTAALALAVDVTYVVLIRNQDTPATSRVPFVAASLAAAAVAALVPAPPRVRGGLLAWAATTLLAWALLGAASIGLLLLPAALLALIAQTRVQQPGVAAVAGTLVGAAGAILTVAAGLALTS
jgi:hypothetical protein